MPSDAVRKRLPARQAIAVGIFSFISFLSQAGYAFGGTDTFNGSALGDGSSYYCKSSPYDQSCPNGNSCVCLYAIGKVSGSVGTGYGRIDLNENYSKSTGCIPFNASMFAIGNQDVEQVDFSGTFCVPKNGQNYAIKGDYHIARSAQGRTESGKVSGSDGGNSGLTLHFTEAK